MKKLGLFLGRVVQLVDCETGEIIAYSSKAIIKHLKELGEENYTLQFI